LALKKCFWAWLRICTLVLVDTNASIILKSYYKASASKARRGDGGSHHLCRAWRKRPCSSSVQPLPRPRDRVRLPELRLPPAAGDGAGGILTPLIVAAIVVLSPENFSLAVAATTVKRIYSETMK
jgi:hypothetical protein